MRKFEDFFNVTLGTWNTKPVYLKLKDDSKPVLSYPYPVPRVHADMFRKEVDTLVNLGILEPANELEWGASSFAKKKLEKNEYNF